MRFYSKAAFKILTRLEIKKNYLFAINPLSMNKRRREKIAKYHLTILPKANHFSSYSFISIQRVTAFLCFYWEIIRPIRGVQAQCAEVAGTNCKVLPSLLSVLQSNGRKVCNAVFCAKVFS